MNDLRAENLHLWRGEQHVLRGVSFGVAARAVPAGHGRQRCGQDDAAARAVRADAAGVGPRALARARRRRRPQRLPRASSTISATTMASRAISPRAENLRYAARLRRACSAAEIAAALERTRRLPDSGGVAAAAPVGRPAPARGAGAPAAGWRRSGYSMSPVRISIRAGRQLLRRAARQRICAPAAWRWSRPTSRSELPAASSCHWRYNERCKAGRARRERARVRRPARCAALAALMQRDLRLALRRAGRHPAAAGLFRGRHDAVSAGTGPGAVAASRHRAGGAVGRGAAVLAAGAGLAVS